MGGSEQSKHQTALLTKTDIQLWCSGCYQPFSKPVKLDCGHKVCGLNSEKSCAAKVLEKKSCLVANCGFKLPTNFAAKDFKTVPALEASEYDVALQINLEEGQRTIGSFTSHGLESALARGDHKTLKSGPKGFQLVDKVNGNGRQKLLVIGKTGTGKSTFCNVIAGLDPNCDAFPVSSSAESCTQTTQFGNVRFNGDSERQITLIDTIGFSDPDCDEDANVISDLVVKLRTKCDYVNLFAILVNGQNPRLDGSLVGMLRIFENMFGHTFWKQVVVVFTRLPMDNRNKNLRKKSTNSTDDERAQEYIKTVEKKFPKGSGLKYLLLDAWHQDDEDNEKRCFKEAISTLWDLLENSPNLETELVQKVETEHAKLRKKIADLYKQLVEDNEKRAKDIQQMKNEFEEFKSEQKREREEEKKERLKEKEDMERRHLDQLSKLLSQTRDLDTKYSEKESVLKLELAYKMDQKQREQDQMKQDMERKNDNRKKVFENDVKVLKQRHESLAQKLKQQGNRDQKLQQQVTALEVQQQKLKDKHVQETKTLEADYMVLCENFENEKKEINNEFEKKYTELQDELEKKKAQRELELRSIQLNDLAQHATFGNSPQEKITEITKVGADGWRALAHDTFIKTEGDYRDKCNAAADILRNGYPDSQWSVFAAVSGIADVRGGDVLKAESNGGKEALKRGWEEEEIWRDIRTTDRKGGEFLSTVYIIKALKSHCNELRRLTDDEKKKVEETIGILEEKEEKELKSLSVEEKKKNAWSCERWRVELIQYMNNTKQLRSWKHVVVLRGFGFFWTRPHSYFSISFGLGVYISCQA